MISSFLVKLPNFGNQANSLLEILEKSPISLAASSSCVLLSLAITNIPKTLKEKYD
jgi:hypothetical protein